MLVSLIIVIFSPKELVIVFLLWNCCSISFNLKLVENYENKISLLNYIYGLNIIQLFCVWRNLNKRILFNFLPQLLLMSLFCFQRETGSLGRFKTSLRENVFGSPKELMKLSVPSLVYAVQNNMAFLALSNLDAAVYQVSGVNNNEKHRILNVFMVKLLFLTLYHITNIFLVNSVIDIRNICQRLKLTEFNSLFCF